MDIVEEITEEEVMSGKLKIIENTKVGNTTDTDSPDKSKSKKISESSFDKVDPKYMKIILPSSKNDDRSLSSMSKHFHETDSIPRGKNQKNTRTFIQSS